MTVKENPGSVEVFINSWVEKAIEKLVGARQRGDKNLDSEVVQEQEQEQEQRKQQDEQKRQRPDYARNPKDVDAWRLDLLASPDKLKGSGFYQASDFKVTPSSQSLSYPRGLLISPDHAPRLHRADQARRLKNVEVVMRWSVTPQGNAGTVQQVKCVILSLSEAETLRRYIQMGLSLPALPQN
jgi:hypothetical protein